MEVGLSRLRCRAASLTCFLTRLATAWVTCLPTQHTSVACYEKLKRALMMGQERVLEFPETLGGLARPRDPRSLVSHKVKQV